jgi:hypothetical protein
MRLLLLILLVANAAFAVHLWLGEGVRGGPPAAELDPQRIRVISANEAAQMSTKVRARACLEWGSFVVADVPRAAKSVDALQAGLRYAERRVEGTASYWVYIPPLPNRRAAEVRLAELKRLGGDEYYLVQDDPKFLNAISLGLFTSEAGAQARREAMLKVGVKEATVAVRDNNATRVYLRFRNVPEQVVARLVALRQEFPGTDVKDCPLEQTKGG